MFFSFQRAHVFSSLSAAALLVLAGCGSGSQQAASGNFAGTVVSTSSPAVSNVALSSARVLGGASTEVTVNLAQPAPEGGLEVQLQSSDATIIAVPASVKTPAGETSAVAAVSTSVVDSTVTVGLSATYGDSVAGTALSVAPPATTGFTVALQPSTVGMAPGHTGSTKVVTTVIAGFKHPISLTASNLPAGVSMTFSPTPIPSPGAGSSKAVIAVQSGVKVGTYSIHVNANDGSATQTATLTLKLAIKTAGAKFKGCWYHQNGHRYQGVDLSVENPGTYPFDAVLYHGATCDPNNWADEFGYWTPLTFGTFDWTFWFADFGDQADTSAKWHVGSDSSQCVSYDTAPDC